jgi:hypothetical protein
MTRPALSTLSGTFALAIAPVSFACGDDHDGKDDKKEDSVLSTSQSPTSPSCDGDHDKDDDKKEDS